MVNDYFLRNLPIIKLAEISLKAFVKNYRYILLVGLLIIIPYNLILLLIPLPTAVDLQSYIQNATSAPDARSLYALPEVKSLMKYSYSILAATIIFNPLSAAVCAYLAKQYIEDNKADFPGFIDSSIGRWGKHIVTSIIYNVCVGLGLVLVITLLISGIGSLFGFILLIPLVIWGVGSSFYTIIIATTDKWALGAIKESNRIIKRQIPGALILLALSSAMGYIFSEVFALLMEAFEPMSGSRGVGGIATTMYYYFGSVISDMLRLFFKLLTAVWYFNRFFAFERISSQNLMKH